MDGNHSQTCQTHNRDTINTLVFSGHSASYGSSFFPLRFMARALRTWAINQRGKNLACNLWHRPQTQLVTGMYETATNELV